MAKHIKGKKKRREIIRLEQWVEIEICDGQTVTTLYPPNEVLRKEALEMDPPAEFVYRRLNFPHGVPFEYGWATDDPLRCARGGHGVQRMTFQTWQEMIERERLSGSEHLSACHAQLPRPEEHGPCDCPTCLACAERIEREGA
jgi:hypothetical protein